MSITTIDLLRSGETIDIAPAAMISLSIPESRIARMSVVFFASGSNGGKLSGEMSYTIVRGLGEIAEVTGGIVELHANNAAKKWDIHMAVSGVDEFTIYGIGEDGVTANWGLQGDLIQFVDPWSS